MQKTVHLDQIKAKIIKSYEQGQVLEPLSGSKEMEV
jgi:hypothetical protein